MWHHVTESRSAMDPRDAGLIHTSHRDTLAHPIHAEFRDERPKATTRHPINLDAILVCRPR